MNDTPITLEQEFEGPDLAQLADTMLEIAQLSTVKWGAILVISNAGQIAIRTETPDNVHAIGDMLQYVAARLQAGEI